MERYDMHGTPQYIYHNQWNSNPSRGYRNPRGNQRFGYETPKYNEDYWCETCDRGFPSQNVLESHKQQHQKCNIDGCQFTAHPKMITKHIQMQHSTGLFKKISNINNAEDIKKWVDERKKKYPTKLNVEKKALEMKEKIERGEKMGLKNYKRNEFRYDGNFKRKNTNNNNHQQRNKKYKPNSKLDNVAAKKRAEKPEISFTANDGKKLKPFRGISDLCKIETDIDDGTNEDQGQKSSFIDDDDDDIQTSLVDSSNNKPTICNALSSLIGNYGSSDEDEDLKSNKKSSSNIEVNSNLGTVVNIDINDTKSTTPDTFHENQSSTTKDDDMCNDSGPEEAKVVKEILSEDMTSTSDTVVNKIENNKRKGKPDNINQMKITRRSTRKKLPSTLLEKLLQNEIRQERNIILQCIKYIRKNDYFNLKNGST